MIRRDARNCRLRRLPFLVAGLCLGSARETPATDLVKMELAYQRGFATTAIVGGAEGLAFDPETGHLWIVNSSDRVFEVTTLGELVGSFAVPSGGSFQDLQVLPNGNLLLVNETRLLEVNRSGQPAAGGIDLDLTVTAADPEGVVLHPGTGTIFVAGGDGAILELDRAGALLHRLETRELDRIFTVPEGITFEPETGHLLAVCEASQHLYLFTREGTLLNRIDLLDLAGIVAPEGVTIDPATGTMFLADTYWQAVDVFVPVPRNDAGPPVLEWESRFGGEADDRAESVAVLSDGYVIAGGTRSSGAGGADVFLLKTDLEGAGVWQKSFGGAGDEFASSITASGDDGLVLAGRTLSSGAGEIDAYLLKTDGEGNLRWERTFGGPLEDGALSVHRTGEGGYVLAGWTTSSGAGGKDGYLVKVDGEGQLLWEKSFGGPADDQLESVRETSDGGYLLGGWTRSFGDGDLDAYLLKTDSAGRLQWEAHPGRSGGDDDARSVLEAAGGGFVAAGMSRINGRAAMEFYLIKVDPRGDLLWERFLEVGHGFCRSILEAPDGGFVLGGVSGYGVIRGDPPLAGNIFLIKTDAQGGLLWQWERRANNDLAAALRATADGGLIIAGQTYSFGAGKSDAYLAKLTPRNGGSRPFRRGDADASGKLDLSDAIFILGFLFLGGAQPGCFEAANADGDRTLDLADPVSILMHLFGIGPRLPEPWGTCGMGPSSEGLGCRDYPACP